MPRARQVLRLEGAAKRCSSCLTCMTGAPGFPTRTATHFPVQAGAEAALASLLPCLSWGCLRAPSAQGRRELPEGPSWKEMRYKKLALNPNSDTQWSTDLAAVWVAASVITV